ncbi:major histocompatibility complex class I-related gene protein-like [Hemicordylus capensis]|uniref:major histocompatibility complex class I-related gene protein-like n=1 Tax=Hemicordylus capensis TaxID=884348 RepID=UPI002302AFC9|nr:major histocompatibility complex class I-related gene protein-like [Hemicordylus capensis]
MADKGPSRVLSLPSLWCIFFLGAAAIRGVCSGSHSLRYFYTGVSSPGHGIPEFMAAGYVDDQLFTFYNSSVGSVESRATWAEEAIGEHYWDAIIVGTQQRFHMDLRVLEDRYNHTGGSHTLQLLCGCELHADGSIGAFWQHSYDGEDFLGFDMNTFTYVAPVRQAAITQRKWNSKEKVLLQRDRAYLRDICIEWLRKYVEHGAETLRKREPWVHLSERPTPDGGIHLSCQVYGFYPQEISVGWLRNGAILPKEMLAWGVVPSGNGTYQTRVVIEVDPSASDQYECAVKHESLAGELRVRWEPKAFLVPMVVAAVGAVLLAVAIAGIFLFLRRRRIGYKTASTRETGSEDTGGGEPGAGGYPNGAALSSVLHDAEQT